MYYLAFFVDYHPFFQEKIKSWLLNHKKYACCVINEENNHKSIPIDYLLECSKENLNYYYDEPWYSRYGKHWYIHSKDEEQSSISDRPNLLTIKKESSYQISLETIDNILECWANKYKWSILPWNNAIRFRSFVFISKDRKLKERFIGCSSNKIKIPFLKNKQHNLLISEYTVISNFSEVVNAIIFEENINTVGTIWDACNCERCPSWLITNIDFDEDSFLYKYLDKYQKNELEINLKKSSSWRVYQPCDKSSFELVSRELILKSKRLDGTAFWIPQNTNLERLKHILADTESESTSYSDLSYLKDFLSVCEWLYGFGRDLTSPENYNCSLFISRDSTIIREIDIFRQEENNIFSLNRHNYHYDLLACF